MTRRAVHHSSWWLSCILTGFPHLGGSSITTRPDLRTLADFFQKQADDWRGWAETRRWESLEGDLGVEARHLYGHVQLGVTMRRVRSDWDNHGWTATGDLTIEPGEQLTQIAKGVRSLAAG